MENIEQSLNSANKTLRDAEAQYTKIISTLADENRNLQSSLGASHREIHNLKALQHVDQIEIAKLKRENAALTLRGLEKEEEFKNELREKKDQVADLELECHGLQDDINELKNGGSSPGRIAALEKQLEDEKKKNNAVVRALEQVNMAVNGFRVVRTVVGKEEGGDGVP